MDFAEAKQKKERGVTVKDVLESALKEAEYVESIVIVAKLKSSEVQTSFSWESSLEALGMLDIAKVDLIDCMRV